MSCVDKAKDTLRGNSVETGLSGMVGGYVARNRNALVQTAQDNGFTHLMFVDNDMTFPPSAMQRLIDADKDIIGVNYNSRGMHGTNRVSTIKLMDDKGNIPMDHSVQNFEIPAGLFKVGALGTGFMLIKTSVFDKLKKPYFVAWESEEGEHHTEDVEFCIQARKQGFDVWCNPTIEVGHIGTMVY